MDEKQFRQMAQNLRGGMLDVACRYLHDTFEAEDVVQDVLVRLWKMSDRLQPDVKGLAQVLTRNLAIDRLRSLHPHVPVDGLNFAVDADDNDNPRYERIARLIARLPDDWQTAFRLRHADGMAYEDIARLMGTTEAAVRQMVSRARRSILRKYQKNSSPT